MLNGLTQQFSRDGRLKLVPAAGLHAGRDHSGLSSVYSYDSNNVQSYMLRVLQRGFHRSGEQPGLRKQESDLNETYAADGADSSTAKSKSKEEATNELVERLFSKIIQHSLESW